MVSKASSQKVYGRSNVFGVVRLSGRGGPSQEKRGAGLKRVVKYALMAVALVPDYNHEVKKDDVEKEETGEDCGGGDLETSKDTEIDEGQTEPVQEEHQDQDTEHQEVEYDIMDPKGTMTRTPSKRSLRRVKRNCQCSMWCI